MVVENAEIAEMHRLRRHEDCCLKNDVHTVSQYTGSHKTMSLSNTSSSSLPMSSSVYLKLEVTTESCEGINRELEREKRLVRNHIVSLRSPTLM
jgi:hypothetical protein